MTDLPPCDKVLLVQAELDGELDAAEAAALASHRAACPICQAAAADIAVAREAMRPDLYEPMPEDVRARVVAGLGLVPPQTVVWPAPALHHGRRHAEAGRTILCGGAGPSPATTRARTSSGIGS